MHCQDWHLIILHVITVNHSCAISYSETQDNE